MTQQQGSLPVDRMCALAQVGRAGYYRHWQAVAPRGAETALRDEVQRLALAQRHYGYRRIAILLRRSSYRRKLETARRGRRRIVGVLDATTSPPKE
jgi:transposase InsO family protein